MFASRRGRCILRGWDGIVVTVELEEDRVSTGEKGIREDRIRREDCLPLFHHDQEEK